MNKFQYMNQRFVMDSRTDNASRSFMVALREQHGGVSIEFHGALSLLAQYAYYMGIGVVDELITYDNYRLNLDIVFGNDVLEHIIEQDNNNKVEAAKALAANVNGYGRYYADSYVIMDGFTLSNATDSYTEYRKVNQALSVLYRYLWQFQDKQKNNIRELNEWENDHDMRVQKVTRQRVNKSYRYIRKVNKDVKYEAKVRNDLELNKFILNLRMLALEYHSGDRWMTGASRLTGIDEYYPWVANLFRREGYPVVLDDSSVPLFTFYNNRVIG